MDNEEHFEFLNFMEQQELKFETIDANKELDEDINPTTGDKDGR